MYLQNLIDDVNKTHSGLGELVAMCQLAITAHKTLLIISPSGCGKSTSMAYVAHIYDDVFKTDSTSRAGLGRHAEELTSSQKVIIVDDLSTTQTPYARISTLTALAALCYTHEIHSDMGAEFGQFSIEDFQGSVLIGIQPKILTELLVAPEWEGTVRDKVLRYYHLKRPILPDLHYPTFALKKADIGIVNDFIPDIKSSDWKILMELLMMEFSKARAYEHLTDLLKASACLDNRKDVNISDYDLLKLLLKTFAYEVITTSKEELEGEIKLNSTLLLLLVEYYTYNGQYTLAQIATDYKISIQQAYRIMGNQNGYWQQISKSPTIYKPSKLLLEVLKKLGLEVKE